MSSNSIFSSVQSEKRWVLAMHKNFPQHHLVTIDSDPPCCVFSPPKTVTDEKPEAYAPRHLGLGPYHHLRRDLYIMHRQKLAAIRKFLCPEKLQIFQQVVNALVQFEPIIRACYDQFLDLDIDTLAWVLAIDGLFLLQFLKNYPQMEDLAGDILVMENQIPFVLLEKIQKVLELTPDDEEILRFLHAQSPLKLNGSMEMSENVSDAHLLHLMYRMIVTKRRPIPTMLCSELFSLQSNDVINSAQFLADQLLPGARTAAQVLTFVDKIPWDNILSLFKKGAADGQTPSAQEIDIPSVSQMYETAGIKFVLTSGGISDIRFEDSEEDREFFLPVIRLTATSEVVLRNLVAYEAATAQAGSSLVVAEYVDLMCGIIDSGKDVKILKKEKIIESELADEEIARTFNGISKSMKRDGKSEVEEAIDNVNIRYNSLTSVRVKRFLAKYAYALFKFISKVIAVVVVVVLILRAYCSVFGCSQWFGKSTMLTQGQSLLFSYM